MRYENRYPEGENGEQSWYQLAVGCSIEGTKEARDAALLDLQKFMISAPAREIEGWLAELSVITARRAADEVDEALRLHAYASRLGQFPADVSHHVVLGIPWKFWPTWSELEAAARPMAEARRQMIHALRHPPEPAPAPPVAVAELSEDELFARRERQEQRMADAGYQRTREGWLPQSEIEDRASARVPHWSETAAPDDPRFAEVRRARQASLIVKPKSESAA